jgi:hypothetical protein
MPRSCRLLEQAPTCINIHSGVMSAPKIFGNSELLVYWDFIWSIQHIFADNHNSDKCVRRALVASDALQYIQNTISDGEGSSSLCISSIPRRLQPTDIWLCVGTKVEVPDYELWKYDVIFSETNLEGKYLRVSIWWFFFRALVMVHKATRTGEALIHPLDSTINLCFQWIIFRKLVNLRGGFWW